MTQSESPWLPAARRLDPAVGASALLELRPYPGVDLHGVVWVPDRSTGPSEKGRVGLYVRSTWVSDRLAGLLPEWADFVYGLVEANDLTLHARGDDVLRDDAFTAVRLALTQQLVSLLAGSVATPDQRQRLLGQRSSVLVRAALADERLFDALSDRVAVRTTEGPRRLESAVVEGSSFVALDSAPASEMALHRAVGRPVIEGTRHGVLALTRRWARPRGIQVLVVGTKESTDHLFPPAELEPGATHRLRGWFEEPGRRLVPARFTPPTVPLTLVRNRQAHLPDIVYVNLDAPVIQRLLARRHPREPALVNILVAFAEVTADEASTPPARLEGALLALLEDSTPTTG